ncbi:NAD(P)H-binding protein [Saccharopolyspora erythraea]|uniref:NAD(P)H-binding protein n=1 Tax=Saccharopolyspora erythraea TaxID=1836 RepID=UPI001BAC1E32|nr:NAD(P)H-binding protein [Saccharopolyspora erythraea]QUG99447.1 NAD(P)H-binding protein [Saccharopolyspora erythraea]
MRVAIAGGHGQIARLLGAALAARGDSALGLVRNPEHEADLRADGIVPVVADLEQIGTDELARYLEGFDAAVFAAGAGPGSGAQRKDTVDRAASALLADACERAGVRRFVQVSAMGTEGPYPPDIGEVFAAYLDAKGAAEQDLRERDLDWTILRPGRLTDDAPTGRVRIGASVARAEITRADVASVVIALLDEPASVRKVLEAVNGDTPIPDGVRAAVA